MKAILLIVELRYIPFVVFYALLKYVYTSLYSNAVLFIVELMYIILTVTSNRHVIKLIYIFSLLNAVVVIVQLMYIILTIVGNSTHC